MTLAVFDGRNLIADRDHYKGGYVVARQKKIFRIGDIERDNIIAYFVGSGTTTDTIYIRSILSDFIREYQHYNWKNKLKLNDHIVVDNIDPAKLSDTVDCMLVLVIDDVKLCFQISNSNILLKTPTTYAIGAPDAQLAARAAMMAGAGAPQAFQIACALTNIARANVENGYTYDLIEL